MSMLVIFINVTGAELTKVNLFGNEVVLSTPESLPFYMVLVLTYFLIRFAQYMHEVEDKGIKDRFFRRVDHYLEPYILRREYNKSEVLKAHFADITDVKYSDRLVMFHDAMQPNTAAASYVDKSGGVVLPLDEIYVSNWELVLPFGVYAETCGLILAFLGRGGRNAAMILSLR